MAEQDREEEGKMELTKSIFRDGQYWNPWSSFQAPGVGSLGKLMWQFMFKDNSKIPASEDELNETLPVVEPDLAKFKTPPPKNATRVFWLGHASVLTQLDNATILFDPIFSERCSPSRFFGPKRYRPTPIIVEELPDNIDACCISHDHYDHLDIPSIKQINSRLPNIQWFVPLGTTEVIEKAGVATEMITELDWWQTASLKSKPDVKVALTPAQHVCRRTAFDNCKRLWGSWCVLGPSQKLFFGGDTAYCEAFKQIQSHFGSFDVCLIPIGAYEPRWFMKYVHVNPEEAVQIHCDLKSKQSVGIHWGTFRLTTEHYLEPKSKVEQLLKEQQLKPDAFITLKHGEIKDFESE